MHFVREKRLQCSHNFVIFGTDHPDQSINQSFNLWDVVKQYGQVQEAVIHQCAGKLETFAQQLGEEYVQPFIVWSVLRPRSWRINSQSQSTCLIRFFSTMSCRMGPRLCARHTRRLHYWWLRSTLTSSLSSSARRCSHAHHSHALRASWYFRFRTRPNSFPTA